MSRGFIMHFQLVGRDIQRAFVVDFAFCLCHKSELERPSGFSLPPVRWLSRLNMAAVGYAERERMRQEQGERSCIDLLKGPSADREKILSDCLRVGFSCRLLERERA